MEKARESFYVEKYKNRPEVKELIKIISWILL